MRGFRVPFSTTGNASFHNKACFSRSVAPDQQLVARAHLSTKAQLFSALKT